jgi:hypothetical protein
MQISVVFLLLINIISISASKCTGKTQEKSIYAPNTPGMGASGYVSIICPNQGAIKLLSATYGSTSSSCGIDILAYMQSQCENKSSCGVTTNDFVFGDPCYGQWKCARVLYYCEGVN